MDAMDPNTLKAFELIVKLAKACEQMLNRIGQLEGTVTQLETEATLRKAMSKA